MHTPLHTPLCDRLGIQYPIFLAGMGGVSMSALTAAVSNAGGLGIIGAATLDPNQLRYEIRKTRDLTDKPFAVDLLAPDPEMIRPHRGDAQARHDRHGHVRPRPSRPEVR